MAPTFDAAKAGYRSLWNRMAVTASDKAETAAIRISNNKGRYVSLQKRVGVPWFFIGLCHLREGNLNFNTYLGNGQSLAKVTTIVPAGRGPFATFEDGAVDALTLQKLITVKDWSLERIAYCLEGFNGFGYRSHGVNSPYLWAGTNHYATGKFVADHVFDQNAVDGQLGSMAVLRKLSDRDASVAAFLNGTAIPQPPPPDIPKPRPPATPVRPAPPAWIAAILNLIARLFGKGK